MRMKRRIPLKQRMNVIYEDNALMVLEKAAGVLSQPVKDDPRESVVELIRYYWKSQKARQQYIGIVQRLDMETSGVLVVAKNKVAQRVLQQQFATHQIGKRYLAITSNIPNQRKGRLVGSITRDKSGKRVVLQDSAKGKEAATRYKVIDEFGNNALLEVAPETGRTHQIRLQLSRINCAIVGEPLYVSSTKKQKRATRCMLHAWKLSFLHPDTCKRVEFESPMPDDMKKYIESMKIEQPANPANEENA